MESCEWSKGKVNMIKKLKWRYDQDMMKLWRMMNILWRYDQDMIDMKNDEYIIRYDQDKKKWICDLKIWFCENMLTLL